MYAKCCRRSASRRSCCIARGIPCVLSAGGRYLAERITGAAYVELPGDYHVPSVAEAGAGGG